MPRGDGTGPQGRGSGTGRKMGPCGGKGATRAAVRGGPGRGQGTGKGRKGGSAIGKTKK